MRCLFCNATDSKVVDTRATDGGYSIRRRRECAQCGKRFTTYEKVEQCQIFVVKRDGRRELFSMEKIKNGLHHACQKLPVSVQDIDGIASKIERRAYDLGGEIATQTIGDMIMDELRSLNEVAYVRFAAVYHKFTDLDSYMKELKGLLKDSDQNKECKQEDMGPQM